MRPSSMKLSGVESSDIEERIAGVRNRVPEGHRAEFDELLGEARLNVAS
jgi:hypothetical protein